MPDNDSNREPATGTNRNASAATGGKKLAAAVLAGIVLIAAAGAGGFFIGKRSGAAKEKAAAAKKQNARANAEKKNVVIRLKNGSVALTLDQLNDAWLIETDQSRDTFVSQENWQQAFVDQMVNVVVLTELAKQKKLDESQIFRDTQEVKEDYTLARLYYQKYIMPELSKITVSDKEVKEYYEKNKYRDYFIGWRDAYEIIVPDKAEADSIYASLKSNPGGFEAMARAKSINTETAPGGGAMGKITREDKRIPPEAYDAYFFTPVGTVSAPVQSRLGWHIVLIKAASPSDMDFLPLNKDASKKISEYLVQQKQADKSTAMMAVYKKDLGVEIDTKLVPLIATEWKKQYDEYMKKLPQMQAPMQQ